ncbi:acetylxylan esterase [Arthrobacter tecti]
MTSPPSPIAGYEDWPDAIRRMSRLEGHSKASAQLSEALGVPGPIPETRVQSGPETVVDEVRIRQLSWQLPYGPPTRAHLLTPAGKPGRPGKQGKLPGVLWLHCHGGNKWLGAERLIDDGLGNSPEVRALQQELYSGQAIANELAKAGFAVLVHDSFTWGSRRFDLKETLGRVAEGMAAHRALWRAEGIHPTKAMEYNAAAALHENVVAKTAGLLGTSYAGVVAFEDLMALKLLTTFPEVDSARIAVGGFSGGGGRALVLSALAPKVRAAVVSCMMTTFEGLFPAQMDSHSWLLATPGLGRTFDWPDLASINPGCRYLMQYARQDHLFTHTGMHDADTKLRRDAPGRYTGTLHDGVHAVSAGMLRESADFLSASLTH